MKKIKYLKCVKCGKEFEENEVLYHCDVCGKEGILDVVLDYEEIKREMKKEYFNRNSDQSLWRYLPTIPIEYIGGIQPLSVGWTPIYQLQKISKALGVEKLYIKDDSRNPTASLKDRASAVGIAKAIELDKKVICAASTGNAASSISGFAASAGLKNYIFVPENAPEAKITQLLIYGSTVFLVKGTYDEAYDLCYEAAEEFGWYNRSCAINPYLVEGKKTVGLEIAEQLNWEVPEIVVMAVGDGCSIAGAWKGFKEAYNFGLTDKLPKMIGIQSEGADPVTRAFNSSTYEFEYKRPQTIADSISVGIPRNGIKALNAIHESGGFMLNVKDEEILYAMRLLARTTGIFGEPAGVTGIAGVKKLVENNLINGNEKILAIITGSGLKDIKSASKAAGKSIYVNPNIKDLKEKLNNF